MSEEGKVRQIIEVQKGGCEDASKLNDEKFRKKSFLNSIKHIIILNFNFKNKA
jgi:hypothetical protein